MKSPKTPDIDLAFYRCGHLIALRDLTAEKYARVSFDYTVNKLCPACKSGKKVPADAITRPTLLKKLVFPNS